MPRLLAAPDSFKGSASAAEIALAIAEGAACAGWDCDVCPMSDGGEGFSEVLAAHTPSGAGSWQTTEVTGPLGKPVEARWWWAPPDAVVECASASGLVLAGGAASNDPIGATSRGTGELIAATVARGARSVLVGLGGSAPTDGGLGAVEALLEAGWASPHDNPLSKGVEMTVACDVTATFTQAAKRFGPQKGASPAEVPVLEDRLVLLVERYRRQFGVDVTAVPGSGAAGGLGGGLLAIGARLVPGFDLVAQRVDLSRRVRAADLIVTGEGRLDETSWSGKVVSGVLEEGRRARRPVLAVVGSIAQEALAVDGLEARSLSSIFGAEAALEATQDLVAALVGEFLAGL